VAGFDCERAVALYSRALAGEELSREAAYEVLDGRAEALRYLGNL
jgi:hypothetical protein